MHVIWTSQTVLISLPWLLFVFISHPPLAGCNVCHVFSCASQGWPVDRSCFHTNCTEIVNYKIVSDTLSMCKSLR